MTTEKFEDFYALLGVSKTSTHDEIPRAFRARMREWHPDVNKSPDATSFTQRLIVAYKILNDREARCRYDAEYDLHFTNCRTAAPPGQRRASESPTSSAESSAAYRDTELDQWVRNARRQATQEWKNFVRDFGDASKAAGVGAMQGVWIGIIGTIIAFVLFSIIAALG